MKRILPAYPIFVTDPYFSIWMPGDDPTGQNTVCWQGDDKPVYGLIFAGGGNDFKTYSFLGCPAGAHPLRCCGVRVTAFSTIYEYECAEFAFTAEFLSPRLPDDTETSSCPVCYFCYELRPVKRGDFKVALFLHEKICYHDRPVLGVRGDVMRFPDHELAYFGTDSQNILSHTADTRGADWGYYYLSAATCLYTDEAGLRAFISDGTELSLGGGGDKLIGGMDTFTADRTATGKMITAFDDVCSIFYYGELLRGAFFTGRRTITDAIAYARDKYGEIAEKCRLFDEKLRTAAAPYGDAYLNVLYAALRQTAGAHKAVRDSRGRLLYLSKECGSDGCIATVDVSYPTMPLYMLYNPELLKGMLLPVFDFAEMPVWEFPFAPHDAGVYPYCHGQYYGIRAEKEGKYRRQIDYGAPEQGVLPPYYLYPADSDLYDIGRQMPVEESSNMLILSALLINDTEFIRRYLSLLRQWADYLIAAGPVPGNQLCTDDFAGHQDGNVNLAIKAAVALAAFAKIAASLGEDGSAYRTEAEHRARMIEEEGSPLPLSFGEKGTYSVKYNLLADKFLGTKLFRPETFEAEARCCAHHANTYGVPLDGRAAYGKSDWLLWMAAATEDMSLKQTFIGAADALLRATPDRVPFPDWYDTVTGEAQKYGARQMFRNRPVQGGCFAPLYIDYLKTTGGKV